MSAAFLRKYNTATHVYVPMVKRGVVDFAVSADWTPATGDVKVSIDGAAAANIGTLPAAITMGNGAVWDFTVAAGETLGKKITVTVVDSATKAVEDQCFLIETYGNASAELPPDLSDTVRLGLTALPNVASGSDGSVMVRGATQDVTLKSLSISNSAGDALTLASTGSNGQGLNASGNGTGAGLLATGGATGNGVKAAGGATSGSAVKASGTAGNAVALELAGQGSAAGLSAAGGATGAGAKFVGGATSGDGVDVTTTSGDGVSVTPTAGNAVVATANGTSKHGLVVTGGTAGTSDGLKAVAGTGGVPIRGDLTGNVTGNLSGSVGSVTGAVGSVTGNVGGSVASVTGNVGGNVVGSVGSVTGSVGSISGVTFPPNFAALGIGATGHVLVVDTLTTYTGNTVQTGDAYARLGAPAGASVSVDVAAVKSDTGAVKTKTDSLTFTTANRVDATAVAVSDKTGYKLASDGVDLIVVESGLNLRQAAALDVAALAGVLSGAATTTVTVKGAGVAATRIVATCDTSGNRSALTLTPPA